MIQIPAMSRWFVPDSKLMSHFDMPCFNPVTLISLALVIASTGGLRLASAQEKNSTQKIRVVPGKLAARIGSGVHWQPSLGQALKLSQRTGKPVFWYVPTIAGSFMDRKTEIDRYMMAGPFSWDRTRRLLNQNYVPVRVLPSAAEQEQYRLKPFEFVEPGFLILDGGGNVQFLVDKITTLHPEWFVSCLTQHAGNRDDLIPTSAGFAEQYRRFTQGDWTSYPSPADFPASEQVNFLMLEAMRTFRRGQHAQAKQIWQAAAEQYPDHPLGWKAAAEAEGFGPFVRGFEIHRELPPRALKAGLLSEGTTAPADTYTEAELIRRGTQFLLGMQRKDGGWVDCDYDFGGTDSLPNVHVAVTALASLALQAGNLDILPGSTNSSGRDSTPGGQLSNDPIEVALSRATRFVTDARNFNTFDTDELLWAYAYRLRWLAARVARDPSLRDELNEAGRALENIQGKGGAWYHEYRNPFVTATALCALHHARQAGFEVDPVKIRKGLQVLQRDRYRNGAYPYATRNQNAALEGTPRNIAASAGRMPLCELALVYWGAADPQSLVTAIGHSLEQHQHLHSALKYDDHTSNMGYGGFFFWYDMRARSEAIGQVRDPGIRNKFARQQRELILAIPELDGGFVDSHELGRCYGTAMALLALAELSKVRD